MRRLNPLAFVESLVCSSLRVYIEFGRQRQR
jgi:hypothetical protein